MTVLDNIRTAADDRGNLIYATDLVRPRSPALPPEVVSALEEFGLEDELDRRVEDLPYGKRRLLAVARAVATRPSVLLLDECAAGLSESESGELAHVVRRLADRLGMGIVVIEHDVGFVMSISDAIVVLDFGKVISHGAPETVRADPRVIKAYLGGYADEAPEDAPAAVGATAEDAAHHV